MARSSVEKMKDSNPGIKTINESSTNSISGEIDADGGDKSNSIESVCREGRSHRCVFKIPSIGV